MDPECSGNRKMIFLKIEIKRILEGQINDKFLTAEIDLAVDEALKEY